MFLTVTDLCVEISKYERGVTFGQLCQRSTYVFVEARAACGGVGKYVLVPLTRWILAKRSSSTTARPDWAQYGLVLARVGATSFMETQVIVLVGREVSRKRIMLLGLGANRLDIKRT